MFMHTTHKSSINVGHVVSWSCLGLQSRCLGLGHNHDGCCLGVEIWCLVDITGTDIILLNCTQYLPTAAEKAHHV